MAHGSKWVRHPITVFAFETFKGTRQYNNGHMLTYDARPMALCLLQEIGITNVAQLTELQAQAMFEFFLGYIHGQMDKQSKRKRQGNQGMACYNATEDRIENGTKYTGNFPNVSFVGFAGDIAGFKFGKDTFAVFPDGKMLMK